MHPRLWLATLCGACLLFGLPILAHNPAVPRTIGAGETPVGQRPGQSIVGQPYSATVETMTVQTLADGTHITREGTVRKEYRDSEGRTRIEYYMLKGSSSANEGKLMWVIIHDPATNPYLLNPQNHTAHEMIPRPAERGGALVGRNSGAAEPPIVEDLGTRTMEGFVVQGKRITRVIPAGAVGNDQPIEIVTERWFSNELGIDLLLKNSDPRQGETTMRTTNIDLSEPDPGLFKVPADYTMQPPRSTF
jgi:hypothetical protein